MSASSESACKMAKSVTKALCPSEKPMDSTAARAVVLLTHSTKEARTFWANASRQPLTTSRFSAWKFCNLLHCVLRYGHPQAMHDSQRQRHMLQQIAACWLRQTDHMGRCIAFYCNLLLLKLEFHDVYPYFTGCLQYVDQRAWDVNVCFQLCSDLLNLLEQSLQLGQMTFAAAHMQGAATYTEQGKCRLQPLVTVAEECGGFYELCVDFLRLLYEMLPLEDVYGLRERFFAVYEQLRTFYCILQSVPYLAEPLMVPQLPALAPNLYAGHKYEHFNEPTAPPEAELG